MLIISSSLIPFQFLNVTCGFSIFLVCLLIGSYEKWQLIPFSCFVYSSVFICCRRDVVNSALLWIRFHFRFQISKRWGAWVAQSVKRPTSSQVTISQSVSSSPAWGSGLMAQSLEPVSDSVSPSLSAPPPFMLCLSLSQK